MKNKYIFISCISILLSLLFSCKKEQKDSDKNTFEYEKRVEVLIDKIVNPHCNPSSHKTL